MILSICSRESDYLQDLTFAGLSEALGPQNVVDFPFHWQFHRRKKHLVARAETYPRNMGFLPSLISGTGGRFKNLESVKKGLSEGRFSAVFLSSVKPDALETFEALRSHVNVPWIFLDGGDWVEIGGDFKRLGGFQAFELFSKILREKPPAAIFKRELKIGSAAVSNVFPLPFSAQTAQIPALKPDSPKEFQVAFWAVESSAARKKAFEILKGRYDCERNGTVSGQTFRKYSLRAESYFEALNRTRISLSFRGEGFDTLRFWEIPACGSLLLSEVPDIQMPDPFVDGQTAVFCKNDLSDLTDRIDYYLARPDEAVKIAAAGQAHLLKHHTYLKRAEYILDLLETRLGLRLR